MADRIINFRNATILAGEFRNFRGAMDRFGNTPEPNFSIQLRPEDIPMVEAAGLRVRTWVDINQDPPVDINFIKVDVGHYADIEISVDGGPSRVLTPEEYGSIDSMEITDAYLSISAYPWSNPKTGRSGVKAYLCQLYLSVNSSEQDKLRQEWQNAIDSPIG